MLKHETNSASRALHATEPTTAPSLALTARDGPGTASTMSASPRTTGAATSDGGGQPSRESSRATPAADVSNDGPRRSGAHTPESEHDARARAAATRRSAAERADETRQATDGRVREHAKAMDDTRREVAKRAAACRRAARNLADATRNAVARRTDT